MNSNGPGRHKSFTRIENRTGVVGREDLVNWIPNLTSAYIVLSQWVPVVAPTRLLPQRSEYLFTSGRNLSDMWRSTFKIGAMQLHSVYFAYFPIACNLVKSKLSESKAKAE